MKIAYMGPKAADHAAKLTEAGIENEVRQDLMTEVWVKVEDLGPALALICGPNYL